VNDALASLLDMLPRGRGRARTRKALAAELGTTDREISRLTAELVGAGYPVGTTRRGGGGVFLCENETEKQECAGMYVATIVSLARRLRAFDRAAYERIAGQGLLPFMRDAG